MKEKYLNPTQESGRDLMMRNITGPVVMLNLLRFRDYADYSETPQLAPSDNISGERAYQLYIDHTLPYLKKSGLANAAFRPALRGRLPPPCN